MSKKKKKKGVPKRKVKYGLSEADFRRVVKQYVVSKMCKESFEKRKIEVLKAFFVGIIKGYEDLFNFMHIKDEEFLAVYKELDPDTVKLEAKLAMEKIMEGSKEKKSGLIIPAGLGGKEIRAAKEIFDKHLNVGGRK